MYSLPGFDWRLEVEQAAWRKALEKHGYRVIREAVRLACRCGVAHTDGECPAPDTLPRQRPSR